jgi:glycosyltransferase involved in cell wall biosynthesis
VNHITGAVNYVVLFLLGKKTVLTVHDIGHFSVTLTGLKKMVYGLIYFQLPLLFVSKVIYISNFTKKVVEEVFCFDTKKAVVIHNYFNVKTKKINLSKFSLSNEFKILQVGSSGNKNLKGLIEACDNIGIDVHLLLVNSSISIDLLQRMESRKIQYSIYEDVSNANLYDLYMSTDIVYFVSLYEGFGLPILEANYFGKPILCSDLEVMREVAGNSALFVNPTSSCEIRDAILRMFNDISLCNNLVDNGYLNLENFSLEKYISNHIDIYLSLVK